MEVFDRKAHWENLYQTKKLNEVSWYQPIPETSLRFFQDFNVPKTAKIIDMGGGDSFLVDHLLDLGYQNITVLDISKNAIERAKQRLSDKAQKVTWIVADAATFEPTEDYDLWHDRAAFHFLTNQEDILSYLAVARKHIVTGGILILGTFSDQGPKKCSGITVKQYSESTMSELLGASFEKLKCINIDHKTPFNTTQNFTFCCFRRK
ncbi:MAG: class I SAM-dependent methyltransferase, partial [Bacteroidota bacterium]